MFVWMVYCFTESANDGGVAYLSFKCGEKLFVHQNMFYHRCEYICSVIIYQDIIKHHFALGCTVTTLPDIILIFVYYIDRVCNII